MEADIIKLAMSQGLWAVLFVALLFYVLRTTREREREHDKKSEEREARLIAALEQSQANNQQFAVAIEQLSGDVKEIKYAIKKGGVLP